MPENELALISRARTALEKAKTICEASEIRDQAAAVARYLKRKKGAEEAARHANEIRLRAERKIGKLDKPRRSVPGGDPSYDGTGSDNGGLSRQERQRYREVASIPERTFEKHLREDPEPTTAGMVRVAKEIKRAKKREGRYEDAGIGRSGKLKGRFRVLYADPPWQYTRTGLTEYGHADTHYPTMGEDDLCGLCPSDEHITRHVLPDAVLWLWTTTIMLPQAFRIMEAWGFTYKAQFIWDKVKHNFGHYNSVRHEILLVGTRGSCTPDVKKLHDSVQSIERTGHSEKPERFREIIDEVYPNGPRVELFARKKVKGWTAWGNQ